MTTVTLDAAAIARFQGVADYAAIRDEAGRVVGYFCPTRQVPRDADGKVISPISDEELRRRSNEPGGRSLKEILADLEKL
jgi:hypothetical protein